MNPSPYNLAGVILVYHSDAVAASGSTEPRALKETLLILLALFPFFMPCKPFPSDGIVSYRIEGVKTEG